MRPETEFDAYPIAFPEIVRDTTENGQVIWLNSAPELPKVLQNAFDEDSEDKLRMSEQSSE